jgi:hypothetical protein
MLDLPRQKKKLCNFYAQPGGDRLRSNSTAHSSNAEYSRNAGVGCNQPSRENIA